MINASPLLALAIAVVPVVAALPAFADDALVHDGYDAFWKTLPDPVFRASDEKPLDAPQSFADRAFRAWGPTPADGKLAVGQHRVEILGPDLTIDHRAFKFARAKVFAGEVATEPGVDARLFVGARDVCVQGTAPSASGTAQRHVHVALVTGAFTRRARRYDLPSLFGSCLALTRDAQGGVRFPEGAYHAVDGAAVNDGVDLRIWRLRGGAFSRIAQVLELRFPDPGNVYRFRVAAP